MNPGESQSVPLPALAGSPGGSSAVYGSESLLGSDHCVLDSPNLIKQLISKYIHGVTAVFPSVEFVSRVGAHWPKKCDIRINE